MVAFSLTRIHPGCLALSSPFDALFAVQLSPAKLAYSSLLGAFLAVWYLLDLPALSGPSGE